MDKPEEQDNFSDLPKEERVSKMTKMLKVQSAPEHIAMVAEVEAVLDEVSIATEKLKRRRLTLENAPSTGDVDKVSDAENAVTKAGSELARAEDNKKRWRGDFTVDCQAPTTDAAPAQTAATPASVVAEPQGKPEVSYKQRGYVMRKKALFAKYSDEWDSMESCFKNALSNGLSDAAKTDIRGEYFEADAVAWAIKQGNMRAVKVSESNSLETAWAGKA